LAVAFLLRWHILRPGDVIKGGESGEKIEAAFRLANDPPLVANPEAWKTLPNCAERRLLRGIRDQVKAGGKKGLIDTIGKVGAWPSWTKKNPRRYRLDPGIGKLETDRGSFKFDDAGLPPSPDAHFRGALAVAPAASPPGHLLAARDLAPRVLLYGLEGDDPENPTSRVAFDGKTLTPSYRGEARDPIDTERQRIDRLVLFDANVDGKAEPPALWAIPVLPGELRTLKVRDAGQ